MFACNGILFNHESPRRGETFVTRKITRAIANIAAGRQKKLYLGNLDAKRDWGFAPEYVECMWLILQQDNPDDYVIGTGESHSVREFLEIALNYAGVQIEWKGKGIEEKGVVKSIASEINRHVKKGEVIVEIDPKYFRPTEVDFLKADISKAKEKLGWSPKVTFEDLVKIMVDSDFNLFGITPKNESEKILKAKNIKWTKNKLTLG